MDRSTEHSYSVESAPKPADAYQRPDVTYLGTVAELTQKTVGSADGATFLGIDIGS